MKYIIQRNDGMFVTPSGSRSSYTNKLQLARIFTSKEEAQRELCPENEHVIDLESVVGI